MKSLYINAYNSEKDSWFWIRCIIHQENYLELDDIIKLINQYLINIYPTEVFFKQPNILFKKITPIVYKNFGEDMRIREITTQDIDSVNESHFYSVEILRKYITDWLLSGDPHVRSNQFYYD